MEECYRRRKVRGRDMAEWIPQMDAWVAAGETRLALELLAEIIAACETLEQFDTREPAPFWYESAAKVYRQLGCSHEEATILERWLAHWPESRVRYDKARDRFAARAAVASRRVRLPRR